MSSDFTKSHQRAVAESALRIATAEEHQIHIDLAHTVLNALDHKQDVLAEETADAYAACVRVYLGNTTTK